MATKPTETFEWSTATTHATGPHSGSATKVDPPGHPANTTGFTPGTGTVPEYVNRLLNILGKWTGWLGSGSSAGAADAHLVETDSSGDTSVRQITATRRVGGYSAIARETEWAADVSNGSESPTTEVASSLEIGSGERVAYILTAISSNGAFSRFAALIEHDGSVPVIIDAGSTLGGPFGTTLDPRLGNLVGAAYDILVDVPADTEATVYVTEYRAAF